MTYYNGAENSEQDEMFKRGTINNLLSNREILEWLSTHLDTIGKDLDDIVGIKSYRNSKLHLKLANRLVEILLKKSKPHSKKADIQTNNYMYSRIQKYDIELLRREK